MRNRTIQLFCLFISFPIIGLILMGIALFQYQQATRFLLMGTAFILIAVSMFCSGLLQLRAARTIGAPIPWWKQPFVILALFFFCFGSFYFLPIIFDTISLNEIVQSILFIPYVLLVLALGFYGIVLAFQFAIEQRKKAANSAPKTQFPDQ